MNPTDKYHTLESKHAGVQHHKRMQASTTVQNLLKHNLTEVCRSCGRQGSDVDAEEHREGTSGDTYTRSWKSRHATLSSLTRKSHDASLSCSSSRTRRTIGALWRSTSHMLRNICPSWSLYVMRNNVIALFIVIYLSIISIYAAIDLSLSIHRRYHTYLCLSVCLSVHHPYIEST